MTEGGRYANEEKRNFKRILSRHIYCTICLFVSNFNPIHRIIKCVLFSSKSYKIYSKFLRGYGTKNLTKKETPSKRNNLTTVAKYKMRAVERLPGV